MPLLSGKFSFPMKRNYTENLYPLSSIRLFLKPNPEASEVVVVGA